MSLDDLEDEEVVEKERRRSYRNRSLSAVAAFGIARLIALGVAAQSCSDGKRDADRLMLRDAVAKFEASPADDALAQALIGAYEARGKSAEAEEVRRRHAATLASLADVKEKAARARLAAAPDDDQAIGQLVEVLAKRPDLPAAKAEFAAFVQKNPTAKRRASLGAWLWRNGFDQEAIPELTASLKEADDPYTRAYLGLALYDVGKKQPARAEIVRALEAGVEMEILNQRIYAIEQELGPDAPPAPAAKPAKRKSTKSGPRR